MYSLVRFIEVFQLTLPNVEYFPAPFSEEANILPVSCYVVFKFGLPKLLSGLWRGGQFTAVAMPKTSSYFDNFLQSGEDDIRSPRQLGDVKPVAISKCPDHFSYDQFRMRVFALYSRHQPTSALWRQTIHGCRSIAVFRFDLPTTAFAHSIPI